jgi:phage tail-like protein
MNSTTDIKKSYSDLLPVIVSETKSDFIKRIIKVFEKILKGIDDGVTIDGKAIKSISKTINTISQCFYPLPEQTTAGIPATGEGTPGLPSGNGTPGEFLEWLSSWVGLVFKEDWKEDKKRKVLANIIPIYRMRGTKTGLEVFLNFYTDGGVTINDDLGLFQVGVSSTVGVSTAFDLVHYFIVEIKLSETEQGLEALERKKRVIKTIVDREKPVHVRYSLRWVNVQSLQLMEEGDFQTQVGINTFLWSYE